MSNKPQTVVVNIMGKDYKIACEPNEKDTLLKSARDLNEQMCKMRDSGKVIGEERIAVMAALNISHELQTLKSNNMSAVLPNWKDSMASMMVKIEKILENR